MKRRSVNPETAPAEPAEPQKRSSYHHGDLRQSLIEAAIALIQTGDMAQLSLREVARQVGVSHNAPYRHFADKDALLSAVAEQGFRGLRQATEQALETAANPAEQLSAIGAAYVTFALNNPVYYRVMFSLDDCQQEEALQTAIGQAFGVLLQTIQAGQAAGAFRAADALEMAQVAWASVHGLAMLAIEGKLPAAQGAGLERFLGFATQLLVQGFGA